MPVNVYLLHLISSSSMFSFLLPVAKSCAFYRDYSTGCSVEYET